jgi:hypothetical protein
MKKTLILLLALIILPVSLAIDITVDQISTDEVLIVGLDDPAQFLINITNNGANDAFTIYTFFGIGLEPREAIIIEKDESREIAIEVFPREDSKIRGYTLFSYFIQGLDSSEIEEKFKINIIEFEEAFEIGSGEIDPESNTIEFYIHNKVNFDFKNMTVKFDSAFFNLEEKLNLEPYGKKNFTITLDKKEFNKLMAGFYTLSAEVSIKNLTAEIEGKIEFIEKDLLITTKNDYGLIISTKVIKKVNEGNTIVNSITTMKKNIISRAFTTFNPEPSTVERQGTTIYYVWNQQISPGESAEIFVRTNWLFPFIVILLIIIITVLAKRYSNTALELRKKVSFIRAKGGEFALKITIIIEAKQFVEKIRILDRLPPLVKMYERFNGELPTKIDKLKKKIEWDFDHLEPGERRVLSYVVYSKVGILGKFALPSTTAIFEKEGKTKQSSSNRAYFLSRPRKEDRFE